MKPTTPIEALRLLERTANTLVVRSAFADSAERQRHVVELAIAADLAREVLENPNGYPVYNPPPDQPSDDWTPD